MFVLLIGTNRVCLVVGIYLHRERTKGKKKRFVYSELHRRVSIMVCVSFFRKEVRPPPPPPPPPIVAHIRSRLCTYMYMDVNQAHVSATCPQ